MKFRIERDPLGEVRVPAAAYYGAQTQRAVENFAISGLTAAAELIVATVRIKKAAAKANAALGRLPRATANARLFSSRPAASAIADSPSGPAIASTDNLVAVGKTSFVDCPMLT